MMRWQRYMSGGYGSSMGAWWFVLLLLLVGQSVRAETPPVQALPSGEPGPFVRTSSLPVPLELSMVGTDRLRIFLRSSRVQLVDFRHVDRDIFVRITGRIALPSPEMIALLRPFAMGVTLDSSEQSLRVSMGPEGPYQLRRFVTLEGFGIEIVRMSRPLVRGEGASLEDLEHGATAGPKRDVGDLLGLKPFYQDMTQPQKKPSRTSIGRPVFRLSADAIPTDPRGVMRVRFPWVRPVAAASYEQDGGVCVLFDASASIDMQMVRKALPALEITQDGGLDGAHLVCLRGPEPLSHRVWFEGGRWILELGPREIYRGLGVNTVEWSELPDRALLYAWMPAPSRLIAFTDPWTKDTLIGVPTLYHGYRQLEAYQVPDVFFFATGNGLVFTPRHDQLRIGLLPEGVRFGLPSWRAYARGHRPHSENRLNDLRYVQMHQATLLDFSVPPKTRQWFEEREHFRDRLQRAWPEQNSVIRFMMARWYAADRLTAESDGLLSLIAYDDPPFTQQARFWAQKTFAAFSLGHYLEALEAAKKWTKIKDLPLSQKEEAVFWHRMVQLSLQPVLSVGIDMTGVMTSGWWSYYPRGLQWQLVSLMLESALQRGDPKGLHDLLEIADRLAYTIQEQNSTLYYRGHWLVSENKLDEAYAIWKGLMDRGDDPRNRLRTTVAWVRAALAAGRLTLQEAITRLETVSFAWRDHREDADYLDYLGDLYRQDNKPAEALRVWKVALSEGGESSGLGLMGKMSQLFAGVILHPEKYPAIQPIQRLMLYYEFQELTPIGELGDRLMIQVLHSFMEMDLLDRATEIAQHLIRNRLRGVEQQPIIEILAQLYVKQGMYEQAIGLLTDPPVVPLSPENVSQRRDWLLQAYVGAKQFDRALAMIGDRMDKQSRRQRVDIYWYQKNWSSLEKDLSSVVDVLLADTDGGMDLLDGWDVVRLAVSYVMQGEWRLVRDLRHRASEGLTPYPMLKAALDFMGSATSPIDFSRLEETIGVAQMESFIQRYQASLGSSGPWPGKVDSVLSGGG
jgi:tetratricopeptide (TPR) repeat protein